MVKVKVLIPLEFECENGDFDKIRLKAEKINNESFLQFGGRSCWKVFDCIYYKDDKGLDLKKWIALNK